MTIHRSVTICAAGALAPPSCFRPARKASRATVRPPAPIFRRNRRRRRLHRKELPRAPRPASLRARSHRARRSTRARRHPPKDSSADRHSEGSRPEGRRTRDDRSEDRGANKSPESRHADRRRRARGDGRAVARHTRARRHQGHGSRPEVLGLARRRISCAPRRPLANLRGAQRARSHRDRRRQLLSLRLHLAPRIIARD